MKRFGKLIAGKLPAAGLRPSEEPVDQRRMCTQEVFERLGGHGRAHLPCEYDIRLR